LIVLSPWRKTLKEQKSISIFSLEALQKRFQQGWVLEIVDDLDKLIKRVRSAKKNSEVSSSS